MEQRTVLLVALAVAVADQLTKGLVVALLPLHARVSLVEGLVNLTHIRNRGAAFGLLADAPSPLLRWILVGVSLTAVVLIWRYTRERATLATRVALGAILGGAAGNLVDRVRLGYVVDFVDLYRGPYHWPAFNVADAAITVGALTLFLGLARGAGEAEEPP